MEQAALVKPEITMGHQMPWHNCVLELFLDPSPMSLDAEFMTLMAMEPQFWAIHSVKWECGHLGILSIRHLDTKRGKFGTELITLPHKGQLLPEDEVLKQISGELKKQIFEHIDQVLGEMNNVVEGAASTIPMTSTHVALEWVKANRGDIAAASERQRNLELN